MGLMEAIMISSFAFQFWYHNRASLCPAVRVLLNRIHSIETNMFAAAVKKLFYKKKVNHQAVLTILYGGQSGNSAFLAKEAKKYLQRNAFTPRVVNMAKYDFRQLGEEEHLLVLVSTHGEGEPPESASRFYRFLFSEEAPRLNRLNFAVCALGDSSYEYFCQTGKDMDRRFQELGGTRLHDRVDCDVEFHQTAAQWLSGVLSVLQNHGGEKAETLQIEAETQRETFQAVIREKYRLNEGPDSATFHVVLSVDHRDFSYQPGDSVSIVPRNPDSLVQLVLRRLGYTEDVEVNYDDDSHSFQWLLTHSFELTTLSKGLLNRYQAIAKSSGLEALLANEKTLNRYLQDHDVADLFADFPSQAGPGELVFVFRKLQARLYSIASSWAAHPGEVHLTIRQVCFFKRGRKREGACSGYLNQWLEVGESLPIQLVPNEQFRLPAQPETPVIMIGAGTGVAPFRAFMQERARQQASSKNWLFFGEKRQQHDFFYRENWANWLSTGRLSRLDLAFSRDRDEKVYVQHKIRQEGTTFFEWLNHGAHVYVCGSVAMGHAVRDTIRELVEAAGNLSEKESENYLNSLMEEGRWHVDVY